MFLMSCAQMVGKPVIARLPIAAPATPAALFRMLRREISPLAEFDFDISGDFFKAASCISHGARRLRFYLINICLLRRTLFLGPE